MQNINDLKEKLLKAYKENNSKLVEQYIDQGVQLEKEELKKLILEANDGRMISVLLKNKVELLDSENHIVTEDVDIDKITHDIGQEIQSMKKGTMINYDKGVINESIKGTFKNGIKLTSDKKGVKSFTIVAKIKF
jgi:hypothetical protein